jgi:hypothetical protein
VLVDAIINSKLRLAVAGASDEDLRRGLAAAVSVFTEGRVTPLRAARAHALRDAWELAGHPDRAMPSAEIMRAATLWEDAESAAAQACFAGWTRPHTDWAFLGIAEEAAAATTPTPAPGDPPVPR